MLASRLSGTLSCTDATVKKKKQLHQRNGEKKKKQLHRAHATTSQRTAGYRKVATD
jgi:hypothetical protein